MIEIYMPLLDEGVDCVRPVPATPVGRDMYLVHALSDKNVMGVEQWLFAPESTVRCRPESWSGETLLVARELVSAPR